MSTRRRFLTAVSTVPLALAGCSATANLSEQQTAPGSPSVPDPVVAFTKRDADTVAVSLDVLDDADYVRVETDTTNQTARLEAEGDTATFTDLDGGTLTVIAVVEGDDETHEFPGQTYDVSRASSAFEPLTPTDEPAVKFVEKQFEDRLTVEIRCQGLGDADYILVESSRDGALPKTLDNFSERVYFSNLEPGDTIEATAMQNDTKIAVIATYTVE